MKMRGRPKLVRAKKKVPTVKREKAIGFKIVIVGFGRVGGALALGLQKAKWPVSVFPRSDSSVRRAASLGVRLADHDDLKSAAMCMLAVPDAAIADVAQTLIDDLGPQTTLIHLSGASGLDVFHANKRRVGSFHPLIAISDPSDVLAHHAVALAANHTSVTEQLKRLAEALQLHAIEIPESGRSAYHAGAVMCAGLAVALLDAGTAALERAGLKRDEALKSLLPLMQSALRGVSQRGLEKSITGPVVRGDIGTVQAHLATLSPDLGSIYRLLSQRALLLTSTLPHETQLALSRLLM
jgi:predicted short-subunit dehydrogenase-like oxidoreductase (DUF2520 family)